MTQKPWDQKMVSLIAEAVRRYRSERRLSAEKLSRACEAVGYPIPRSVIANLESGRRETVSVAEWLTLAEALGVPPMLMLFPVGILEEIEILPGRTMSPWEALKWAESGGPVTAEVGDIPHRMAVWLFRSYERGLSFWRGTHKRLVAVDRILAGEELDRESREFRDLMELRDPDASPPTKEEVMEVAKQRRQDYVLKDDVNTRGVKFCRNQIRHLGLKPPAPPPGLEHIDEYEPPDGVYYFVETPDPAVEP